MLVPVLNKVYALPLFSGLNEQEMGALIQEGKIRVYPRGRRLFAYGDDILHFYIICDGEVQIFRETPDGHEVTTDILIGGDTIAEFEILQSHPVFAFNAVAVKDSVIMEFSARWLQETVKGHGILALNLLVMIARRANTSVIEAEHKSTMSAAQQVACFLERFCMQHQYDPRGFDLPYSKSLLASRLGMEAETFSRALAKIRKHGISVVGTRVSFEDVEKIGSFVCDNCSISDSCPEYGALRALLPKKTIHAA